MENRDYGAGLAQSGAVPFGSLLEQAVSSIKSAGIENAEFEARLLISAALGWPMEKIWRAKKEPVGESERRLVMTVVGRRLAREPFAYISGVKEFWSLDYVVGKGCLIPRPDSECLVETSLEILSQYSFGATVLDVGTGSGCLLLSVLSECPLVRGVGIDLSWKALEYARRNAARFRLSDRASFVQSRWFKCLNYRFDLILCNPPYVRKSEINDLMPDVALYEPEMALDGGVDGLDGYRILANELPLLVASGGRLCLEIGKTQEKQVKEIFHKSQFYLLGEKKDLSGTIRCLEFGI